MPRIWTHSEAFAAFGTKPRNVRWSWSARNEEKKIVVATLWHDQFKRRNGRIVYEGEGRLPAEKKRPGLTEWVENLAWAEDHCAGRLSVIIAVAKDQHANPRAILDCVPTMLVMRLVRLNRTTGRFLAEAERPRS